MPHQARDALGALLGPHAVPLGTGELRVREGAEDEAARVAAGEQGGPQVGVDGADSSPRAPIRRSSSRSGYSTGGVPGAETRTTLISSPVAVPVSGGGGTAHTTQPRANSLAARARRPLGVEPAVRRGVRLLLGDHARPPAGPGEEGTPAGPG